MKKGFAFLITACVLDGLVFLATGNSSAGTAVLVGVLVVGVFF
jgi:hypothetical protein